MKSLILTSCVLLCLVTAGIAKTNEFTKKEILSDGLVADYFYHDQACNQKGLILLGGAEGGKAASQKTEQISTLTEMGYAVLVPAYFGMKDLPPTLQSIPLEYFEKAMDWLTSRPGVDPNSIGIIGGSKGSEAALLLASHHPKVKVVVVISPSAYVFWGIRGPGGKNQRVSSWSYGGKDIPYAPLVSSSETIRRAMETGRLLPIYQEAISGPQADIGRIPVEKAKAALLLLSGEKDTLWPSAQMAQRIVNRLKSCEYPYPVEHISFDVGHNVPDEAPQSWDKLYQFLKTHY